MSLKAQITLKPIPSDACWVTTFHMTHETGAIGVRYCKEVGVSYRFETPCLAGRWGKQRNTFITDGDDREFARLSDALRHRGFEPPRPKIIKRRDAKT